jgi:ribose transport system ATP-binding protein
MYKGTIFGRIAKRKFTEENILRYSIGEELKA